MDRVLLRAVADEGRFELGLPGLNRFVQPGISRHASRSRVPRSLITAAACLAPSIRLRRNTQASMSRPA